MPPPPCVAAEPMHPPPRHIFRLHAPRPRTEPPRHDTAPASMPRRPPRGSLRAAAPLSPSPAATTPASSAYPSTRASETDDEAARVPIASLTLDTPLVPLRPPGRRVPETPFPFLALPSELRIKVYEHYFADADGVLDLGPDNHKRVHRLLGLMRVCKQTHAEATPLFYSSRPVRVFPTYPGRYFKSKKPLLARLKAAQRACITALELRLGPGWNAPPRGWVVNDALGLADCARVRKLSVFVECDPSDGFFKGFRRADGFYEAFSRALLTGVLDALPAVAVVEFDAWSGVKKSGAMMRGLLDVAAHTDCLVGWGPERGWTDADDEPEATVDAAGLGGSMPMQGYAPNVVAVA